ncbi:MAG TPA: hypothetical protein VKJ00_09065 [Thermoanaerobaculia bacterium]|nr:hypothetical protein [Thermoanaerobaculia bacterium]
MTTNRNRERSRQGWIRAAFAAAALPLLAASAATGGDPAASAVAGKLVVKGKTLSFTRAWLVRGADTFDDNKMSAYLILANEDLSGAIAACTNLHCVLWDTVKNGAILQPVEDGHQSFWLRVVVPDLAKEQQISGRTWTPSTDRHDRLAGRLQFSYSNVGEEADLTIDAPLAREFPTSPPLTPTVESKKKGTPAGI